MKHLTASVIIASAALAAASCSSDKKSDAGAATLLSEAREAVERGAADRAISLIDSLTKSYPTEIELVKEAMQLRPQAIEKQSITGIAACDSAIEQAKTDITNLEKSLRWVKEERMIEGFWVDRSSYNPSFMNTTGVQARVSDIGQFYIVSSVDPGIRHTSITLSDGAQSVSTPAVAYDGESNYRVGGGEIITFSPEQSDTIGQFAAAAQGRPLTLRFNGGKSKSVKLSAAQSAGIANAWRLSKAMESGRNNDIERQRLQRQLEIARSQQQRLASKPE